MSHDERHVCPSCGARFAEGGYCTACGTQLQQETAAPPPAEPQLPAADQPDAAPDTKGRRRRAPLVIGSIVVILLAMLGCAGALILFAMGSSDEDISAQASAQDQTQAVEDEVVDVFGPPEQFIIAYLPREGDELVRTEIWYYPEHEQKVTFVEGRAVSVDPMEYPGEDVVYPDLDPTQFDLTMGYDEVMEVLGGEADLIEETPELLGEFEVETYVNDSAVFAIEGGRLVYIQTIGIGE